MALTASGCASAPALVGEPGGDGHRRQRAAAADRRAPDGAFVLGPLDKIQVRVVGLQELEPGVPDRRRAAASPFPMRARIQAGGKTPGELVERSLEAALRRGHVRNPQVSVNLMETVSHTVTVDGEVGQPGIYPRRGPDDADARDRPGPGPHRICPGAPCGRLPHGRRSRHGRPLRSGRDQAGSLQRPADLSRTTWSSWARRRRGGCSETCWPAPGCSSRRSSRFIQRP